MLLHRMGRLRGLAVSLALTLCLTACAGSTPTEQAPPSAPTASSTVPSTPPPSTAGGSASQIRATTTVPTTAPAPSSAAVALAPICTKEALQDAVNAGRDTPLTVSDTDFSCQDTWAVAGANDLVNKAQYTFLLRWTDDQWQQVADRSQACANNEVPAALFALGCQSN